LVIGMPFKTQFTAQAQSIIPFKCIIMSGPGVGFEYPPTEVSWLKRDVLLFANTIGCTVDELHFLYVIGISC
jgi:hypothetical protein